MSFPGHRGRAKSAKREFFIAIISAAIAFIGALDLIGHPARTVHILTIFAGGLGAGAGLGRAIDRLRGRRVDSSEPPVASR